MTQHQTQATQHSAGIIQREIEDKIMRLTMSSPLKKNAINDAMYMAMRNALDQAATNDEIHVVILSGANHAFSSGNDLSGFSSRDHANPTPPSILFLNSIAQFPKPIIAKVDGVAVGIGSTMLLHCDLVYASDQALFQFPFVNLGLVPEAASSYILPRLMGHARAAELILLGDKFNAQHAYQYGLVNRVYRRDELAQKVEDSAQKLANKPLHALQQSKKLLKTQTTDEVLKRIRVESSVFSACLQGSEFKEAYMAFQEKRKPNFSTLSDA